MEEASVRARLRRHIERAPLVIAMRATPVIGPRPAAMLLRRSFHAAGLASAAALARHVPDGVDAVLDVAYCPDPYGRLDVFRPANRIDPLPLLVWVHGGGWFGGSRAEARSYYKIIAARGYAVVAPDYGLTPRYRYPAPVRHVLRAIEYVSDNSHRFGVDSNRIVIAGDSAGAQIASQIGGLVSSPSYGREVGISATISAEQLRGLVLACGFFDLELAFAPEVPSADRRLFRVELAAYAGHRNFMHDAAFATMGIAHHVTAAYPPTLITVGNADVLRPHSELLAERLRAVGRQPEEVFHEGHEPPLGHEYQFDLDGDAGAGFLDALLSFLARHVGERASG